MNFSKLNIRRYLLPQDSATLQTRAVNIINLFRLILSLVFIYSYLYVGRENWWDTENAQLFFNLSIFYAIYSVTILIVGLLRPATLMRIQPVQIIIDIALIIMLMHAAGGIQSGLGLLLIITIVTASLVSNGRLALFYAAIATIGLLLEQSYQILKWSLALSYYTQPVMLGLSCFATAWLAYSLAKRMQQSETLASERGVDLENLAQLNALITQEMHDGILVIDPELNIRHQNLQAETFLSLSKNNVEKLSLANVAPAIAPIFNDWIQGDDVSHRLIISTGNRDLKLQFMAINQARNLGAVIFIQDWSQVQSAAQQAKLAALGRLTANIAHEIRNPLSAISHANQLLQEDETASATTKRILQIIADNTQRIDQIIIDVLELNRRDRTHREEIDLSQFLPEFHSQFCTAEKIPPNYIELSLPEDQQSTTFDRRHLTQILWNLCKNAWDHSQKNTGSVVLTYTKTGVSGLNIEVQDDGTGVTEENRSRLFEPFFTTKVTGNGLGLYISRELSQANGANLKYEALTQGSAFIIQLKKA